MKYIFTFLIISANVINAQTQNEDLSELNPIFSAVIVSDMDTSISWYQDILGFEIVNQNDDSKPQFRQANLKNGNALIELIEIQDAVKPKEAIQNFTSKTRLIGLFKIGYSVSDFDTWIERFSNRNVKIHGRVVTDEESKKRMVIILDPDGNRIQIFEQ